MLAEVAPYRRAGALKVDGPLAVVVQPLVELVAGQRAKHAGHQLRTGDAVIVPHQALAVGVAGAGIDLDAAEGRRHGGRHRFVAVGVQVGHQPVAPLGPPRAIVRGSEQEAQAL